MTDQSGVGVWPNAPTWMGLNQGQGQGQKVVAFAVLCVYCLSVLLFCVLFHFLHSVQNRIALRQSCI